MRARAWILPLLAFAVLASPPRSAMADDDPIVASPSRSPALASSETYRAGEVIVRFRDGAQEASIVRAMSDVGGRQARPAILSNTYLVKLAEGASVLNAVRELSAHPEVDYAEPNGVVRKSSGKTFTPNDTFYFRQWNMQQIGADRIWALQKGTPDVAVAVLDTGVAYEDRGAFRKAPDFGSTVFLPGYDFVNNDSFPDDDEYHGTHVASTIAEATNNGAGVAGLAYMCAILPVKILDAQGEGSYFEVAEGIDFAAGFSQGGRNPVKVINMSFGGEGSSETVIRAIGNAVAKGILLVAASGNEGRASLSFPASRAEVMAVGSVDYRKLRASYSNFGSTISVVAPGGDCDRDDNFDGKGDCIFQQMPDPDFVARGRHDVFNYFGLDGTSMATPHVSAAAALLFAQGVGDPVTVRTLLENTAEHLGSGTSRNDEYGSGLIQPAEALAGLGLNVPSK